MSGSKVADFNSHYFIDSDEIWHGKKLSKKTLDLIIYTAFSEIGISKFKNIKLEILYIDDEEMRNYNFSTRKIDKATNVLSFENKFTEDLNFLDGSIIFSLTAIKNEAFDEKKTFRNHLIFLFIHGFLHILGYDHQNDFDANKMETLERNIFNRIIK